jgi:SRSO17 transposase
MVLALDGANPKAVRAMHLFISEGAWEDKALLQRHWQEVDRALGEDDGVLTLDGSDFLKQEQQSVGVKRQYWGEVGKRANDQAGVYLGYARRKGYTLLDRRLYLPHEWVEGEAYAERRRTCGVPEDLVFTTKPMLGGEMLQAVHQAGTVRARWVTCEEAFGRDTSLLDQIEALGLWYLAEVPHDNDTQIWRQRPDTGGPAWSGQGRKPTRRRVLARAAAPLLAQGWARRTIEEGSKGPF